MIYLYSSQNSIGETILVLPKLFIVKSLVFPVIIKSAFETLANSKSLLSGSSYIYIYIYNVIEGSKILAISFNFAKIKSALH